MFINQKEVAMLAGNFIFGLMVVLVALVDMATDLYIPMIPEIVNCFKIHEEMAGATISLNLVGLAVSGLFYGNISDMVGRRPVIIVGLSIFMLASFFCGLATNISQLMIARFFQGLGGGVAFSVGIAVVRDIYAGGASGASKFSQLQAVIALSPCLGPLVGGIIGSYYGWSAIFYILSAVSWLLLIFIFIFCKETLPKNKRSKQRNILSIKDYKKLFGNKMFLIYASVQVLALSWLWAELSFLPMLLQNCYNISISNVGIYIGSSVVFYFIGTLSNQKLVYKVALEKLVFAGIFLFIMSCFLLFFAQFYHLLTPLLIIILKIPASFGFALVFGNAITLAIDQVPEKNVGSASALIGAAELLAGALGISIVNIFEPITIYPLVIMILASSVISMALLFKKTSSAVETAAYQR